MNRTRTILVVDDEKHIRDVVQYALEKEGFVVALAEDGAAALLRHASGVPITLTPTEFGVLTALLERPGVVLSRAQLMQRAYPYDNLITERTIDTHVKRLRAKFREASGVDPIATVHGIGYKAS